MRTFNIFMLVIFLFFVLQGTQTFSQQNTEISAGTAVTTQVLPVPPAPTLLRPQNNSYIMSSQIWLVWRDSAVITSYHVQLSHDSNYVTTIFDTVLNTSVTFDSVMIPQSLMSWLRFYWHVSATNGSGTSNYSQSFNFYIPQLGVTQINSKTPKRFRLYDNYPNPFNPETNIRFDLPKSGEVKLIVYNVLGQEVANPLNVYLEAGSYSFKWDGAGFPSGIYFYKITAGNNTEIKKMVLLK